MQAQCEEQQDDNHYSVPQRKARKTLKTIHATAPALDHSTQLRMHSHSRLLTLWLFYPLFQTFEICEEVVNIRLRELV